MNSLSVAMEGNIRSLSSFSQHQWGSLWQRLMTTCLTKQLLPFLQLSPRGNPEGTRPPTASPLTSTAPHQHRPWSWRCSQWHTWWCRWPGRSGRWALLGWQTVARAAGDHAGPGWPRWPLRWPASGARCRQWLPGRRGHSSPLSGPRASLLRSAAPGIRGSWWWGSPPKARKEQIWGTEGQLSVPTAP